MLRVRIYNNLYDAINVKHAKLVGWSFMFDVYNECSYNLCLFYT